MGEAVLEESVKSAVRRCAIKRMVSALITLIILLGLGTLLGTLTILIGAYLLIGYLMDLVCCCAQLVTTLFTGRV
jgi:hypothetical protein